MARIGKLVVVGVGLIGGSFALALKEAGAVGRVTGVGRGGRNIRRALELKIIDAAGAFDRATFADADLALLAVPVGQMRVVMRAIAPLIGAKTVVTDAGSTKEDVIALARRELKGGLARFVPGHPIAGTEKSGAESAFAGLYRGRRVVLTPLAGTEPRALALVRSAWRRCGASVSELQPREHDAVLAAVSHLPHVLAYALVEERETALLLRRGGIPRFHPHRREPPGDVARHLPRQQKGAARRARPVWRRVAARAQDARARRREGAPCAFFGGARRARPLAEGRAMRAARGFWGGVAARRMVDHPVALRAPPLLVQGGEKDRRGAVCLRTRVP